VAVAEAKTLDEFGEGRRLCEALLSAEPLESGRE
jgi:hypothetical protein